MNTRHTTLVRGSTTGVTLVDAVTALRALTRSSVEGLAMLSSERKLELVGLDQLNATGTQDVFKAECWTPTVSLRWAATSTTRPFTGLATLLAESTLAPNGWTLTSLACVARTTRYACWGDVSAIAPAIIDVGDDARHFTITGSTLTPRAGDRLSLVAVEYITSDTWGNHAVFDERPTGLVIDRGEN